MSLKLLGLLEVFEMSIKIDFSYRDRIHVSGFPLQLEELVLKGEMVSYDREELISLVKLKTIELETEPVSLSSSLKVLRLKSAPKASLTSLSNLVSL